MSRWKVRDRDKGMERILNTLRTADRAVVVGIRQGDGGGDKAKTVGPPGARRSVPTGFGPTLAEVAARNEFGDSQVPERSFLRSTFDQHEPDYWSVTSRGIGRVVDGKDSLDTVLKTVGLRIEDDVKGTITTLDTPPNHPDTIEQKGSDNPLIDSGRMRQAIGYELRDASNVPSVDGENS